MILNKKTDEIPEDAVYVGRPTKWGNPFTHIPKGTQAKYVVKTRGLAVQAYRDWIMKPEQKHLRDAARLELRDKHLVCWCAPLACHAEVLQAVAKYTDEHLKRIW